MREYQKFIKDRALALFRVKCDRAFLEEYFGAELMNEENLRKEMAKLSAEVEEYEKKKIPASKENKEKLLEYNQKLAKLGDVRDRIRHFEHVESELKGYIELLKKWKGEKRFL